MTDPQSEILENIDKINGIRKERIQQLKNETLVDLQQYQVVVANVPAR